jgi:catechol 2,3-dioxygenase-like lactoylglutathione lyase family enzyme
MKLPKSRILKNSDKEKSLFSVKNRKKEPTMKLIQGIHHLTFVTADMDRLISYYQRVFDAKVTLDLEEEGVRHAFIHVGDNTVLHPFQIPGIEPPSTLPMFQRGRLDHFAFNATSEDSFRELRRRVIAEGRDDGKVIDMGLLWLFSFTDPDEAMHEVVWWKPDGTEAGIRKADWKIIEME